MAKDSCRLATCFSKPSRDHDHMINLRVEICVFFVYEVRGVREKLEGGAYGFDSERWDHEGVCVFVTEL